MSQNYIHLAHLFYPSPYPQGTWPSPHFNNKLPIYGSETISVLISLSTITFSGKWVGKFHFDITSSVLHNQYLERGSRGKGPAVKFNNSISSSSAAVVGRVSVSYKFNSVNVRNKFWDLSKTFTQVKIAMFFFCR